MRLRDKGESGSASIEKENASAKTDTTKYFERKSTKMDDEMGGAVRGAAIRALPAHVENACAWSACLFTKKKKKKR